MPATIYDVAKKAGVSIATVSRVINNSDTVSERTRQQVEQAIKELNYAPNVIASALTKKSTLTLGLLIPDVSNPFFSELARGVEDASNDFGFNTIMCNTDYSIEKEATYIGLLKQKSIDGFIISTAYCDDVNIINLLKEDIPLVLLGRDIENADGYPLDVVGSDNIKGGYIATRHLIELGHKKIACLLGPEEIKVNRERKAGYIKALKEASLKVCEDIIFHGEFKFESGYNKTFEIFNGSIKPTAVFAANDLTALGVIRALKALGLSVPNDVSVVGYDNTILAEIAEPPLTTVNQEMRKMGYLATELIIKRIRGEREAGEKVICNTDLIVRKSTAYRFD